MSEKDKTVQEEQPEQNPGVYVHEFRKPYSWDGKEYETLSFDFDSLTGADVLKILDEQSMLGQSIAPIRQFDAHFQLGVAVRACKEKLSEEAYKAMPMGDFNKILDKARGFLLAQGL